jgi:hypothetical protein
MERKDKGNRIHTFSHLSLSLSFSLSLFFGSHTLLLDINHPNMGWLGMDVCAHAACGPIRNTQTTGTPLFLSLTFLSRTFLSLTYLLFTSSFFIASLVAYIAKGKPVLHFATGTSSPCTSTYPSSSSLRLVKYLSFSSGLFKPMWIDAFPKELAALPADTNVV